MSERERWIVYPLLFLALGAALRDKLLRQTVAERVFCRQLLLVDESGVPQAALDASALQVDRIQAGVVDAKQLLEAGGPVAAKQSTSLSVSQLWRILQYLQQAGALRLTPSADAPPAEPTESEPAPAEQPAPAIKFRLEPPG